MTILDTAIHHERGVSKLAVALGVRQSVVSNWRVRGLPKPWRLLLEQRYGPELAQALANSAQPAAETIEERA